MECIAKEYFTFFSSISFHYALTVVACIAKEYYRFLSLGINHTLANYISMLFLDTTVSNFSYYLKKNICYFSGIRKISIYLKLKSDVGYGCHDEEELLNYENYPKKLL